MTPQEWIAHDPDPVTAAELAACGVDELAARFARPLRFGTAGLRGPVRGGPDAMNVATVSRASWAVARVLKHRGLAGSTVIVGRDARHGSATFATAAAEVFAAAGFSVLLLPDAVPTPVVAFAVRRTGAAAGIQITASHNPPADNGYKVYAPGGFQIVSPTDRDIEAAMAAAPFADQIDRRPVQPNDTDVVERYIERAAAVRRSSGPVRVALTPLHGVGGAVAVETLRRAGIDDVHTVAAQFAPDPDFPTVAFPNPEEPGATDALLALAADVGADVALALDPDADRCAVGIPTPSGWRMLSGDETGWLLGDYILAHTGGTDTAMVASPVVASPGVASPGVASPVVASPVVASPVVASPVVASPVVASPVVASPVVASTVVSSRMLAAIAARHGARHVETLTGFKWLARADANCPGATLVYAYEEAIGHCVDPAAVRDKDGISAAVLTCDLVASLKHHGLSVLDALDALAHQHGVHVGAAVSRPVADTADASAFMRRLRADPPASMAGFSVTTTDLLQRRGPDRTDALIFAGGDRQTSARVVVRPSGTEPKVKCYLEIRCAVAGNVHDARERATALCERLAVTVRGW